MKRQAPHSVHMEWVKGDSSEQKLQRNHDSCFESRDAGKNTF